MKVWVASTQDQDGMYKLQRISESPIEPYDGWIITSQEHESHMTGKDGVLTRTLGVTRFDSKTGTLIPV